MRDHLRIIIEGQTQDGKTFRPSDWSERLCDLLAVFGRDQRIRYSPLLLPMIRDGLRCVVVDDSLRSVHPYIYQQIIDFAQSNRLNIIYDGEGPAIHAHAA